MNSGSKKELSVSNVFSIPLTPDACIDLLREIINHKKWDEKNLIFLGNKTPQEILKIRAILADKNLSSVQILQSVKEILDNSEALTIKRLTDIKRVAISLSC